MLLYLFANRLVAASSNAYSVLHDTSRGGLFFRGGWPPLSFLFVFNEKKPQVVQLLVSVIHYSFKAILKIKHFLNVGSKSRKCLLLIVKRSISGQLSLANVLERTFPRTTLTYYVCNTSNNH